MRNLDRAPEQSRGAWIPAWRWALATTATVALAVALGVTLLREQPMLAAAPTEQQEEFKVAENLDLLQDFELIAALDQLETETTTDMSQENL
jgi:anti-sigma-K factor RskA